jgi:membrane protease YdiL (CAAX protease family)
MKRVVLYLAISDTVFVLLLSLSASFSGIAGKIIYYLAFLVPAVLLFLVSALSGEARARLKLTVSPANAGLLAPLIAPTVAAVLVMSYLTSLILSAIGLEQTLTDVSGNIFLVILKHAVAPAILEEALFRYLPLTLLMPYSKKGAVVISSVFFAIVHGNFYQMPYAFIAGLIFGAADIAFNSIAPSVALHFINNLVSVFWLRYSGNKAFLVSYIAVLAVLSVFSLILIYLRRGEYRARLSVLINKSTGEKSNE